MRYKKRNDPFDSYFEKMARHQKMMMFSTTRGSAKPSIQNMFGEVTFPRRNTFRQKPYGMLGWVSLLWSLVLFGSTAAAFAPLPPSPSISRHPRCNVGTVGNNNVPKRITVGKWATPARNTQLQMIGRMFRRDRNRRGVKTLEPEEETKRAQKTKKKQTPEPLWRVMLYGTEWQPDIVARILASTIPALDRRAAFELCTHARFAGKVALVVTTKKQAEMYSLALQRKGLPVTIEPYDVER